MADAPRRPGSMLLTGAVLAALAVLPVPRSWACGPDSDCRIGQRSYRVALTERPDPGGPPGAILFFHGYQGNAGQVTGHRELLGVAAELGVALIAAQAQGADWNLPGAPGEETSSPDEELAYVDALLDDAVRRFGIERRQVVAAGFSSGAMLVWQLACQRGGAFAGYVPMSGTFWMPVPEHCPGGPVDLIHYHGTADQVVPLHGRPIKDARQGDVSAALALMTRTGDYRPIENLAMPGLECSRSKTAAGRRLELCLFKGGHEWGAANLARAWRAFGLADGR